MNWSQKALTDWRYDLQQRTLNEILAQRRQDMAFLLENNMDIIIEKALEGRQQE